MRRLLVFAGAAIFGYVIYRLYVAYVRPTPVRLDQRLVTSPPLNASRQATIREAREHTSTTKPGLVNLNTAGPDALTDLPGIGPALANRIVEFREQNGPFERIDDLAQVQGIGSTQIQRMRPFVTH